MLVSYLLWPEELMQVGSQMFRYQKHSTSVVILTHQLTFARLTSGSSTFRMSKICFLPIILGRTRSFLQIEEFKG